MKELNSGVSPCFLRQWRNAAGYALLVIVVFLTLVYRPDPLPVRAEGDKRKPQPQPAARSRAQGPSAIGDEATNWGSNRYNFLSLDTNDPLSAGSGAYYFRLPLLSLGGPMDLRFDLFYRSTDFQQITPTSPADLPFSFWWRPKVTGGLSGSLATFQLPDANLVSFKKVGTNWVLAGPTEAGLQDNGSPVIFALKETSGFFYLMDPIEERIYIFQRFGSGGRTLRIIRVLDRSGNQLIYSYAKATDTNPSRIEDGLGRRLDLRYGSSVTVTDQGGRQVVVSENGVTDALKQKTTFTNMEEGVMERVTLPRGNTPYTQAYPTLYVNLNGKNSMRPISQQDASGNTTTLQYDAGASKVTVRQPDGSTWRYEHFSNQGLPKAITDPTNKTARFTQNTNRQLTGITDRMGDTTTFTYHAETGKLASITNARGDKLTLTYTAQNQSITNPATGVSALAAEQVSFTFYNLTRIDYADGTHEEFTYDANGNVILWVDRAGETYAFTYNSRGQVLTATNPTGGVTTFTYNPDATLATSTDSETGTTTYTYDTYKRLTQIIHPDGSTFQIAYNLNDQITAFTDENNRTTTFSYDANGNPVKVTDAAGKETVYTYDVMDRLARIIDRLGKASNFTYDALGRLASVTDATSVATQFGYDPRGWLNRVTRGRQTWRRGYDDEGMVASRTTPLGNTFTRQRDKLGFLTGLTNPLGHASTFTRDSMSRITGATDPLNRATAFSYDSRGLLSGVTQPVIGTATYARDALGNLTRITDLNGQEWRFTYTPMGRLQSQTDPLGNTWQHSYDTRGRLMQTTFPDRNTRTLTYDAASNLTRILCSDGTDLRFTYDALDRLIGANEIQLTRDAEGRIINTENTDSTAEAAENAEKPSVFSATSALSAVNSASNGYSATYDDAGRLKTVTYNNGAFTVTYTYDSATGLLTQVKDSLTNAQVNFAYDNDFRPIGITRSNGVNTTLTWDKAARLTRIQDGQPQGSPFLDLQYTLDAAGQVTQLEMTAPLDPAQYLVGQADSLSYDAASQVSTSGYAYDQRGRLTRGAGDTFAWDGASRLVRNDGATLGYNGLGELTTRTEGGTTTRYFYNYALGLAPIVAEFVESGAGSGKRDSQQSAIYNLQSAIRYYVWTPAGQLLYMIDAGDGNKVYFYHFDRTGSTLALTNATGAVTDAYAYEPYGELLAHQGNNPQPFTFVGQWGVRQEDPNGTLYHTRARYYDAVTGRFISRDPVWPGIGDSKKINPYQYALGDPMSYVDPSGTQASVLWRVVRRVGRKIAEPLGKAITLPDYPDIVEAKFESGGQVFGAHLATTLLWDEALTKLVGEYVEEREAAKADPEIEKYKDERAKVDAAKLAASEAKAKEIWKRQGEDDYNPWRPNWAGLTVEQTLARMEEWAQVEEKFAEEWEQYGWHRSWRSMAEEQAREHRKAAAELRADIKFWREFAARKPRLEEQNHIGYREMEQKVMWRYLPPQVLGSEIEAYMKAWALTFWFGVDTGWTFPF